MLKVTCSCNQIVIFFSQEQVTFSTHVLDLQERVNFIIWLHSYKILFLLNVLVLGDYFWNKASLQTSLERNSSNFSYISFLGVNFENLTVRFHILMFLTCISNFIQIRYYLLFDQLTYFLYTTLDYKNLKL